MRLSPEEQQMLDGKEGPSIQKAMELLMSVGEAYGADSMIKVAYTHLVPPDVMFWTTGKLGKWSRELVDESVRGVKAFKTATTLDPVIFDPDLLRGFGYPQEHVDEMKASIERGVDIYKKLGVIPAYTCCPFFVLPAHYGEHIATAETTVQLFSNSILGARTNKESGPTALASALTGRTPFYGMHLSENRRGQII